ncbi:hypothetical protein Tco_1037518 [Tanacetum coccineum]
MNPIAAQQVAFDNALVAPENRVKIGICNMRIDPKKTLKEPTYQVAFDALELSPLYPAFPITPEEDFMCQIHNRDSKKQEKMYYPRFSKAIIQHFISKAKSISMRNRLFIHIVRDDSNTKEYQVYGALIPKEMTNRKMRTSTAYTTYLAFAIGAASPKKARKFKKPTSPSEKKTLLAVEELVKKPANNPATRRQPTGVQIRDTPGVSVSKKKAPAKAERSKGIELLSKAATLKEALLSDLLFLIIGEVIFEAGVQIRDTPGVSVSKKKAPAKAERSKGIELLSKAAILKEALLKKVIKRIKRETDIHQAGGSSEGAGLNQRFLMSKKASQLTQEDSDDDNNDDDQQSDDEQNVSDNPRTSDEEEDEFVHTPDDYVPTDNENIHDEEYDRINKEMYSDVNVELKDTDLEGKGKDDKEMTDAEKVDAGKENVNQEVKEATISTTSAPDSSTLTAIHQRLSELENEVKTLRNIDHSSAIRAAIKSEVLTIVKEYLGTSLDDTLHKVIQKHTTKLIKEHFVLADAVEVPQQQHKPHKSAADIRNIKMEQAGKQQETKYTITSSDSAELQEFDQKITLFATMTKTKSFNKNTKYKALYHALMESIIKDEDAMDKGVAEGLKKRTQMMMTEMKALPQDQTKDIWWVDVDDGVYRVTPAVGEVLGECSWQSGEYVPWVSDAVEYILHSAQAEETAFEAGDTQVPQDLRENMGNTDEPPVVKANPKDWFKKPERPPTLNAEWNECKIVDSKPSQKWLSDLAKVEQSSKTFDDLMSTPIDFSAFAMNCLQISDLTQDILIVPVDYFFNNDLAYLQGGSTGRTYTTSLTKTKAAKYDLQGIEDMNRLFNLVAALRTFTRRIVIQKRVEDLQLVREKKLMCSHEIYKFSDDTLILVQDKLKDMLNNLEMAYISVMPRRIWSNLDKKWSRIMVKYIDH